MKWTSEAIAKTLGFKTTDLSVVNFPTALTPEHLSTWGEFCSSKIAYELYNRGANGVAAIAEVGLAFYCYLMGISKKSPFIKPTVFDLVAISTDRSIAEYRPELQSMEQKYSTMLQAFSRVGVTVSSQHIKNNLIRAFVPRGGYLYAAYVLRRAPDGSREDLSAALKRNWVYWFGTRQIPKLYSPTGIRALRNAPWPKLKTVADQPSAWTELSDDISIARVEGNVLVLRKKVWPQNIVYMWDTDFSMYVRSLNNALSRNS